VTTTFCQELPAAWTEKRLKFAAPLRIERTEATSEHADYLGLENIQSWTGKLLQTANGELVSDEDSAGGTANRFRKGDVLFGKLRPYLAKAIHAGMDGVCTTELLVLKPQPDLHPRFLLYTVLSPEFVGQVDASTFGAKMPRANWDFVGSMKVPVPSFDIQRFIVDYLDRETHVGLVGRKTLRPH
jgi:type I restriction enzyme S subunit